MPDQSQLTLFGSPEVRRHGQIVTGFRTSKAQALLYYIAVTGRPHTRATLAGLLWGDQPEDAARASLSKCLSNLRDLLGDAVLIERQTVALNHDHPYDLDTERFAAAVSQPPTVATSQALQAALALYRGDLLEGFYVREAPDFEQWLLVQRAHYREMAVNGLQMLAHFYVQQGELPQAIVHTRRLLALEPWREEAHRQLMTLLARSGQRAAALAQFEACRRMMAEELAVEPDAETVDLYNQISMGKFSTPILPGESNTASPTLHPQSVDDKHAAGHGLASQNPLAKRETEVDWGEAPDVSQFHGRQSELAQLHKWLVDDRCRVVAVLGIGGVGKTALTTKIATQVESAFACVIWRSLRNAPPVEEFLGQCLQAISHHEIQELPASVDKCITLLMGYLQRRRCLLVLDNFETVLQSEQVGTYRPGYEGYGQLLQRIGERRHQSCLLLTSREKPQEFITLAGTTAPVRLLPLASLSPVDGKALLQDQSLTGSNVGWLTLHQRYSGNPLALKIVSETIRELFLGNIDEFLSAETFLFDGIVNLLTQQFGRLSALEQEVMLWLAVEREPIEPDELQADLVQPTAKVALLEALQRLRQRSLVERTVTGFTLQNVVLEYLTAYLVEQIGDELSNGVLDLGQRYGLLKAQAKSYVQESQRTLLLAPIVNALCNRLGRSGAEAHLRTIAAELRCTQPRQPGYAGGNLLNLLVHLNGNARGLDFSQLAIWQADLRSISAEDSDFRQVDWKRSVFTDTFAGVFAVAFSPDGERLAATTLLNEIYLWRVKDSALLLTCRGHANWIWSICFSPDGRLLASGSHDHTIRL
jgi:DNA-binding SARP family transcriptional activator